MGKSNLMKWQEDLNKYPSRVGDVFLKFKDKTEYVVFGTTSVWNPAREGFVIEIEYRRLLNRDTCTLGANLEKISMDSAEWKHSRVVDMIPLQLGYRVVE